LRTEAALERARAARREAGQSQQRPGAPQPARAPQTQLRGNAGIAVIHPRASNRLTANDGKKRRLQPRPRDEAGDGPLKPGTAHSDGGRVSDQNDSHLALAPAPDLTSLLTPQGRLTSADASALREAARHVAAGGRPVRIDCVALEDLGGAALQVLLALAVELQREGTRPQLANLGPAARRTMSLSGAINLFDTTD
jgi:anti-anti-sigma regulatory factor